MEECTYIINSNDYAVIMMGCGIGYFMVGYLITAYIKSYRNQNRNVPTAILAEVVQ
jgi:hypothetical protein